MALGLCLQVRMKYASPRRLTAQEAFMVESIQQERMVAASGLKPHGGLQRQ